MFKKSDFPVINSFWLFVCASFAPLVFYAWEFKENAIGDPEDFAHFGSFTGGTIGALLQCLNLSLLILVYRKQTLEHRENIQQQYVAFVAPIIKFEIDETEKSLKDIRLKSLAFNSPQTNNPPIPRATLNDFLKKPDLLEKIIEEDISKVINALNDYASMMYYMGEMILDLHLNNSPHFVYTRYIKKLENYSKHVLALNNIDKNNSTLLLRKSIDGKMKLINEVLKIS